MMVIQRLRLQYALNMLQRAQNVTVNNPITDGLFSTIEDSIQSLLDSDPNDPRLNSNVFSSLAAMLNDTTRATYGLNDTQVDHLKHMHRATRNFQPLIVSAGGLFTPTIDMTPSTPSPIPAPFMRG